LPPQARFSVNADSGCAPFTTKLTNQMANADSWTWHFPEGTPTTSLEAHPTVTYTEPGVYEVELIVSNPLGQDTLAQMLTVRGEPQAAFTANGTLGSNVVTFSSEATDAENVIWDFGDGTTISQANPTHVYEEDGTYEVRLVALSDCGSDATTKTVTIVTAPEADFAATTTSGCAPLRVQFDNQSSANATDFEWQFSNASLAITTQRSPTVEFADPGTYTVTLIARNAAGEAVATKTDFISVLAAPQANFNFNVDEKTVRFNNFSQNADDARWLFGDGATSEALQPEHTYANPGMYNVLLITSNACGSDTSRQLVQIGGAAPVANFSGDIRQGCAPFTVQFFENAGGNVASRRWYFPGGEPAFSTGQNPLVAYAEAGDYPVALVVENVWGQDSVFIENYISVSALPQADFTYAVDGFEVQFIPETGNADWQYTWDFGDGNTSTQPEPAHAYARSGMYEVELAVSNWCGTQVASERLALAATSVPRGRVLSAIKLSPNPNGGQFQLALRGEPQRELLVQITDALGRILHERRIHYATGSASLRFDLSDWKTGRYWLHIRGAQAFAIRPFVIQKP
jgi:PKD repeat protein